MKRSAISLVAFMFVSVAAVAALGQRHVLEDSRWKLVQAGAQAVTNSMASIEIDRSGSRVSGNTGCNAMSGTVTIRGRRIDFGPMRTTKRACKLMEGNVDEGTFLNGIESARRFEVRGDDLRLYDRRGRMTLRFVRDDAGDAGTSDLRLEDRKWVLEQIKGRQTFAPLPYAFISFDSKKMSAGGDSSCNSFGGSYSTNGTSISITHIIHTMRACLEDNRMSLERDLLDGLMHADRYEIRNDRLSLYQGGRILLAFRPEQK